MTDSLNISGGNFVVTKDGRNAINTAGHYVMGLPSSVQSLSKTLTYPDPPKGWWYQFQWQTSNMGGGGTSWGLFSFGALSVSLLAQEWVHDTIVCAAPTVADGTALAFLGKIRLNRTTAPSHNVNTATLSMRVPANVWIPNSGSLLLEHVEFGVSRTLTLMVSGGNLILRQRQSVTSAYPGGSGSWYGDTIGSGTISSGASNKGGYWVALSYGTYKDGSGVHGSIGLSYAGILAYHDPANDVNLSTTETLSSPSNNAGYWPACDITGSYTVASIPNFTDPTNYSSVYTVDIEGEFVRLT